MVEGMEDDQIVDLNGLRYEGLSARQSLPQLIDFCHVKAPLSLRLHFFQKLFLLPPLVFD